MNAMYKGVGGLEGVGRVGGFTMSFDTSYQVYMHSGPDRWPQQP